ncbi:MAG: hypothetical protein AAFP19_03505 [Bacteroidota bacterium]
MMMKKLLILGLLVFAFLEGCIPSVHPLYTEKDIVIDARLVGDWLPNDTLAVQTEVGKYWNFKKEGENTYHLTYEENGQKAYFQTRLVQLGEHLFIDYYPHSDQNHRKNSLLDMSLFPVHIFARVELSDKRLKLYLFDVEWLEELFKNRQVRIKHEQTGDHILLTAPTEDLQQFFLKYAEEEDAYADIIDLKRKI